MTPVTSGSISPPKGMVLTAGFGTRLQPFTLKRPKPLFPFFGVSLLDLALFRMREAGIKEVCANAHHLADVLATALKQSPLGTGVELSVEDPEILGRGGAFMPLKAWRAGSDIVVYNGDAISDLDIKSLITAHRSQKNVATMMLLPKPIGRDASVYCVGRRIVEISKTPPAIEGATAHGFASLHILTDKFLALLPQSGASDVLDAYRIALTQGLPLGSEIHPGFWHAIDSPQNAWDAHVDLLQRGFNSEKVGIQQVIKLKGKTLTFYENANNSLKPPEITAPVFVGPFSSIAKDAAVGPNVILSGEVTIGAGAIVRNSLLLNGVRINAGEHIENAVVGFDGDGKRVSVTIQT